MMEERNMPHEIAAATGCTLAEAMGLMLLFLGRSHVVARLLVYHNRHPEGPPILARSILEGPPTLPFDCDVCDERIECKDDLSYDFLFEYLHLPKGRRTMLVEAKNFRRDLAHITNRMSSQAFDCEITAVRGRLITLESYLPQRRVALEEALASLLNEEDALIEDIRKRLAALEFKLEKPEDWGTHRE
jgi:hypothetical protein